MQTVVCMRWGTLFPAEYVNRLYRGVRRHTERPTRFVAFTDDVGGLDEGIETRPIPEMRLAPGLRQGPWRKLALWARDLGGLVGDVLFLDLDVVVTGPLDPFFDLEPGKLCLIRNWTSAAANDIGNSSVMRFPAGSAPHLHEAFDRDGYAISWAYDNEQIYLTKNAGLDVVFWPSGWCVSFKHEMKPRWPVHLWRMASLPEGARIVVFTGLPRPHQAIAGEWPAPFYKKFYKSIRPMPWLAEHWR